jgi:4-alpha-glucanotransferase
VVYTGTHDNDTTVGWWTSSGVGDGTRKDDEVKDEHARALAYLDAEGREIHWAFIRAALASVADTAIVPLQDVLGLGSAARMNLPGRASGNWRWRFAEGALTDEIRDRLRRLAELYGRIPKAAIASETA